MKNLAKLFVVFLFASSSHAATFTWDGGGGNPFWSTGANWVGDVAPGAGDDLVFPDGALQLTNNNDLAVTFNSITIEAGGYLLQGAAINVSNGIATTHGSGTSRIHSQINTATSQTFDVASGGTLRISTGINNSGALTLAGAGTYLIDGVLSGTGTIERTAGQTYLQNNNTFTGALTITCCYVEVTDPIGGGTAAGLVVLSGANAQLRGSGEVGIITGNMGRLGGGTLLADPTLTTGDITLSFLLTYDVTFLSPTVPTSLDVNGIVTLDNPTLNVTWIPANTPAGGTEHVIIDNDGADAVLGQFLNLPEGATFTQDGVTFGITYTGGDGNDVALIVLGADLGITKVADDPTPFVGQNVTFTITVANAGPGVASGVTVTDTLPAGLTYVSATPSQGSCSGTNTVTCNLGAINDGASATVTLVATVTTSGTIVNTATVTSDDDTNGANNTSSTTLNAAGAPVAAVPALDPRAMAVLAVLLVAAGAFVLRG